MKKNIVSVLWIVSSILSCAKKEQTVPVTSVSITQTTVEMVIGETFQLDASVLPSDATDKTVSWTSSQQSVATVSSSGLVTAITEGISTITAVAGRKSATCSVIVKKKVIAVESISIDKTELRLVEGEKATLIATVEPENATDKAISWSSSDFDIVTVNIGADVGFDTRCYVLAVKEGVATITAKSGDKSVSCTVTVEKRFIPVQSITLTVNSLTMLVGEQEQIAATVMPEDATDPTILWESSTPGIASVDGGLVSALSKGEAIIKATSGDYTAECSITIVDEDELLVVGAIPNDSPIIHFEGGVDVVSVTGPSQWNAEVTEGGEWCSTTLAGNKLEISTKENYSMSGRTAVIMVSSGAQRKYVEVYQVPQIRRIVPDKTRHIRLTQKVHFENRSMALIWIMLPYIESDDYQTIKDFKIGTGGEVRTSKDGRIKYVSFAERPAEKTGTVTATIDYIATTNYVEVDFNKVNKFFEYDKSTPEYAKYTGINEIDGNRFIDPENPTLSAIADQFWESAQGNIIDYCYKCYDYVATAFEYQAGGNGIIVDILANGGGDCGNISNLFLSMVRHKGIPARPIVMTQPHNENHVRTEFYLAGYGWIPVDPTYHMSGSNDFGKFTDNWVVSNRDETILVGIDNDEWKISILQGCNWWWWCWSDGGDVTGSYDLSEVTD